jgi:hypothetical protein
MPVILPPVSGSMYRNAVEYYEEDYFSDERTTSSFNVTDRYDVTTITQGMTVQAVNGTDENELRRLVEMVLQTWPSLVESSDLRAFDSTVGGEQH